MKLKQFQNLGNYNFVFVFENDKAIQKNIRDLIASKVSLDALQTARLDNEWGCLEFKEGMVDIEPKTLYRYLTN